MTNEEQKLREFADKWGIREDDEPTFDPHTENPYYGYSRRTKQCLSDLTALISEHYYPKEFVLWTHHQDYWHFDIITDMWYSDDDPQLLHEITTDELFDYWTNNVKQ